MGNYISELILQDDFKVVMIDTFDDDISIEFDTPVAVKKYLSENILQRSRLSRITIRNAKMYWEEIKANLPHCGFLKGLTLTGCDLAMVKELAHLLPGKKLKKINIELAPGDEINFADVRTVLSLFPCFGAATSHKLENSRELCSEIEMCDDFRTAQLGDYK